MPTVSPGFMGVLSMPWTTFARGSENAAWENDTLSGIFIRFFSTISFGTVIYWAYAPFRR